MEVCYKMARVRKSEKKQAPVVIKNEKSDEYTHIIMPLKS